jgi:methylisocitrate lyase
MNQAALETYQEIRSKGTQKGITSKMQTRDELYDFLDYHSYEQKLDELFASRKGA